MKILLLAPHPFFQNRGTPIAERAVIQFLLAAGHQVDVLTFPEGDDPGIPGCRVLRVPRLPGIDGVRPGFSLKKVAYDALLLGACLRRAGGYDLIHAVEESAFIAALARALRGVPYVYDMDSSLAEQMADRFPGLKPMQGLLERCEGAAARRSTGILTVCRALTERARRYAPGVPVGQVEDTTLLGDGDGATESVRRAIGREGPIVMYVGNLEPYQGIDLLLEGFAQARDEAADAQLVIVGGDAPSIARYRARAEALQIGGRAHFLGPRPVSQLGGLLRQADVLASPRLTGTNTPMKVYSYLDSGTAILATDLPTHTQVLDADIACLVAPEPAAVARGLVRLLRDPAYRAALAHAGRERVQREYTPAAGRRKLAAFYDEVLRVMGASR